jgi:hypothetical protein
MFPNFPREQLEQLEKEWSLVNLPREQETQIEFESLNEPAPQTHFESPFREKYPPGQSKQLVNGRMFPKPLGQSLQLSRTGQFEHAPDPAAEVLPLAQV